MKKYREQLVNVGEQRIWVDVPVDEKLYKLDNHEDYQRRRSNLRHISIDENIDDIIADTTTNELTADVIENYEKSQLIEYLQKALQTLKKKELRLIDYLFYEELTGKETAEILKISPPAVTLQKQKIIEKLRKQLNDWLII